MSGKGTWHKNEFDGLHKCINFISNFFPPHSLLPPH